MSNEKNRPIHTITFGSEKLDQNGNAKIGKPVTVATVWPRHNGKQGGNIEWHIPPENLGKGAYFLLDHQRNQYQNSEKDAFDNAEKSASERDTGLSR